MKYIIAYLGIFVKITEKMMLQKKYVFHKTKMKSTWLNRY